MRFEAIAGRVPIVDGDPAAFLVSDNWNDWFKFYTQFYLRYRDATGDVHDIGQVKIGQFGMGSSGRTALPASFGRLDSSYFSVGQDDTYYETLNDLGIRVEVLGALRDIAFDTSILESASGEEVLYESLLRSVNRATVELQYSRMATGGARVSEYRFDYVLPQRVASEEEPLKLSFRVTPDSQPPSNIHVLIGRNGVGKTRLLNSMVRAALELPTKMDVVGRFEERSRDRAVPFVNLVAVSFSAFDDFFVQEEPDQHGNVGTSNLEDFDELDEDAISYTYIGLRKPSRVDGRLVLSPMDSLELSTSFSQGARRTTRGPRLERWQKAIGMLESDPIFRDADISSLGARPESETDSEYIRRARSVFDDLSSGHKIVLLTITRLVETVSERSMVLMDEPEAHLHPPLLGAFVRALSDLLVNRNGIALVATHSPVVLQEVPRTCAWRLRRAGDVAVVERPTIETFGENVGTLTREIFGLEVTRSGFHTLLESAVDEGLDYEDVIDRFRDQLGGEAKAIVRTLIAYRDLDDEF